MTLTHWRKIIQKYWIPKTQNRPGLDVANDVKVLAKKTWKNDEFKEFFHDFYDQMGSPVHFNNKCKLHGLI